MKKTTTYNLARATMTLLLALFTTLGAWAEEESLAAPSLSLGDLSSTSAQIQCSPGGGDCWDLRYRTVADGTQPKRWTMLMELTGRSFTLENLKPGTQYEVQARSVYNDGDDFSDWSPLLTFTTDDPSERDGGDERDDEDICQECAKGDMAEIIWVLKGQTRNWYDFAVQIVDAETGTEMAWLTTDKLFDGGTVWLCCGRKYNVNWIFDESHASYNGVYALSLLFEPGDEFFSMKYGEAPDHSALLTSFIMDCGNYCERRPTNLTATDVTYNSATLVYNATTLCEQLVYTTDPKANPDELRSFEVNREQAEDETTYTLEDLEPNTTYYIWARSVCSGTDGGGYSRWTDPIKVRTKSPDSAPSQIDISQPASKKAKLRWKRRGKEKRWNIRYRKQGQGLTMGKSQVLTLRFGAGSGFGNQFGADIYDSKSTRRTYENVLVVGGAHEGDVLTFKARQRNSSAGDAKFFIGSQKMDRTMKLDAQAQLLIQEKQQAEAESGNGPDEPQLTAHPNQVSLFSILVKMLPRRARAKYAAQAEPDEYYFYLRHNEESDLSTLTIEDLMLIPAENQSEWTVISNVTTTEYMLTGLESATTYEVLVEPVYDDGTTGEESPIGVFTTLSDDAEPLSGVFSVGEGRQVRFSKGNLNCYTHNGGEWSFADHQYDVRGNGNLVEIGDAINIGDHLDLFCWSTTTNQYGITGFRATSEEDYNALFAAPYADWGSNPALVSTLGSSWQTLSQPEWTYLLCERPNATERVAYANVNGQLGIIVLPDEWTKPADFNLLTAADNGIALITEGYAPSYAAPDAGISNINAYTAAQWAQLEEAGAVFLPTTGILGILGNGNAIVIEGNNYGCYWSSSDITFTGYEGQAFSVLFNGEGDIVPFTPQYYQWGSAVRLVKPVTVITPAITLDETNDNRSLLADVDGETCNVTLNRSLLAGSYNTFAAPFDIDAATLADMGIKAKKLVGSTLTDDVLTLTFADATTIEAGHPYLVKLTTDVDLSLLSFDGVTVSQTAVPTQTAVADFVPTLGKTTISGSNATSVLFVGADNTVCHPQSLPADMKGFRAYFQLKGQALTGARRFSLDLGNGETTGIGELEPDGQQTAGDIWHALDGHRMTGQPKAKGVYVRKGQTVIMK